MNILFYEHQGVIAKDKTTAIYGISQADAIPIVIGEIFNTDSSNVINIVWENNIAIFVLLEDVIIYGGTPSSNSYFNRLDEDLCIKVVDLSGKSKQLGDDGIVSEYKFFNYLSYVLEELSFSEVEVMYGRPEGDAFNYNLVFYGGAFKKMWLPKLQGFVGYCNLYNGSVLHPNAKAYVHPFLKTNNNGERDATIDNWASRGLKPNFVYTMSPPITPNTQNTINEDSIGQRLVYLKKELENGNDLDEFEVYDGETLLYTLQDNEPIPNLVPNTSYNYGIKVRDSSDQWTSIGLCPFTTNIERIPESKLISNYDFEESEGDVLDTAYSGNDGTSYNLLRQQEGKIGYGARSSIDGSRYFKIPTAGIKSMTFWTKINAWSTSDPNDSYIFDGRSDNTEYLETTASAGVSDLKVDNVSVPTIATSIPLGVWSFVYVEFTNTMSAGNLFMCTAYVLYNRLTTDMNIDLLSTFNSSLTEQELIDMYNNGNGSKL